MLVRKEMSSWNTKWFDIYDDSNRPHQYRNTDRMVVPICVKKGGIYISSTNPGEEDHFFDTVEGVKYEFLKFPDLKG